MFCDDPSNAYPLYTTIANKDIGFLRVLIGVIYVLMLVVTIIWVKSNERVAAKEQTHHAVNSVIFPVYTRILWLNVICNAYVGLLLLFVPVSITDNSSDISRYLYPLSYSIQHFLIEGVAFMLMQKGCGKGAARKAIRYSFVWGVLTYALMQAWYSTEHLASIVFHVTWSIFMLVFFACLWLLPQDWLYRRPAAIWYAKFWFWFRVVTLVTFVLSESQVLVLERVGRCSFSLGPLLLFPIVQPYLCYKALLEDSLWWKGAFLDDELSPLAGFDINHDTAQSLGIALDQVMASKAVTLLNFAHIHTAWNLLGQGSFSKVYRGTYKHVPCALKVMYNVDLTPTDIKKAIVEATILSALRHPNIVEMYGVCVNPPNLCLVIELCARGSLADVLRAPDVLLGHVDRLFLALGCCQGLCALHALSDNIVHRDIKSMNFLVDGQLNAKLADLELGQDETSPGVAKDEGGGATSGAGTVGGGFLLNWMPPEFIRSQAYTKASDVYALALVLWEIMSQEYPFNDLGAGQIRDIVLSGGRPDLSVCSDEVYRGVMKRGWSQQPEDRFTAEEMRDVMWQLWRGATCCPVLTVNKSATVFSSVMDGFMQTPLGKRHSIMTRNAEVPRLTEIADRSTVTASSLSSSGSGSFISGSFTSPMHVKLGSRDSRVEEEALKTELKDLHALLLVDPLHNLLDHLSEAVLVLTRKEPHLIVHCSTAMEVLLGVCAKDLFGMSLASTTAIMSSDCLENSSRVVSSFLREMRSQKDSRSHAVVNLVCKRHSIPDSCLECSLNSFAIHQVTAHSEQDEEEAASLMRAQGNNSTRVSSSTPRSSSYLLSSRNRRSSLARFSAASATVEPGDESINYFAVLATPLTSKSTSFNL